MPEPIEFGGLQNLPIDERIPFGSAITAEDCVLDDFSIRGRAGYRANHASAGTIVGSGTPRGLWRYRSSPTAARAVAVVDGTIYTEVDPTGETVSDGTASAIAAGPHLGSSANISAAQLGPHLYLGDDAGNAWRRMGSAYSLETLSALAKGVKPTSSLSSLALVRYLDGSNIASKTASGGATSTLTYTDWYVMDNGAGGACPVGGILTVTLTAAEDWRGYGWVAFLVTPPTKSQGLGHVEVAINKTGGNADTIGETFDDQVLGGSPNVIWCPLTGASLTNKTAVKTIQFQLTQNAGKWAVLGHMLIPMASVTGTSKYIVTFYNSSTTYESEPTEELEVALNLGNVPGNIPAFHSVYSDKSSFNNPGNYLAIDPVTLPKARDGNYAVGKAKPGREDYVGVPTIAGAIPAASQFPAADTVRLWRLTETEYRLVKTVTLTGGETTYSITDDLGDYVLGNQKFKPGGKPPTCNAMASRAGRLVAGYENRLYISSFLPTSASSNPFPQFPAIAIEDSDGWSFDLAPSNAEQIQCIVNGDALYIGTNEAIYSMSDLSPNSIPYRVAQRGVISRRGMIYISGGLDQGLEDAIIWAAYDGIFMSVNRSRAVELTEGIRRFWTNTFLPDSTIRLGYRGRKLFVFRGTRQLRFDFVKKAWTAATLADTISETATWLDPGSANPQLWLLTSGRKLARWQEGTNQPVRDMQVGTDVTTGTAIPAWDYSTGFMRSDIPARIPAVFMDVTGPVTVNAHKTASNTEANRDVTVTPGLNGMESDVPFPADMRSKKWRLRLRGNNQTILKYAEFVREPVQARGA